MFAVENDTKFKETEADTIKSFYNLSKKAICGVDLVMLTIFEPYHIVNMLV